MGNLPVMPGREGKARPDIRPNDLLRHSAQRLSNKYLPGAMHRNDVSRIDLRKLCNRASSFVLSAWTNEMKSTDDGVHLSNT